MTAFAEFTDADRAWLAQHWPHAAPDVAASLVEARARRHNPPATPCRVCGAPPAMPHLGYCRIGQTLAAAACPAGEFGYLWDGVNGPFEPGDYEAAS